VKEERKDKREGWRHPGDINEYVGGHTAARGGKSIVSSTS
jgi:hypothetical protein